MIRWYGLLLISILMLSACGAPVPAGPRVRIENAWVSPSLASTPGMTGGETTSAGYFTIVIVGGASDTLLSASSEAAVLVRMHETRIVNNIASMAPLSQLEIPAQSRVEFKPGARHLMLMGILYDLKPGIQVPLMLRFAKSGTVSLMAPVQPEPAQ